MNRQSADRNLRLLNGYWFLRQFQVWAPVWIVFLTIDNGFSLGQVTLAYSVFLLCVVVLEVPTGAIADRYGRSRSLALGAALLALAILLFAFSNQFAVLVLSFVVWSVAVTLMSGADSALLFDTLKAVDRSGEYERLAGRGAAIGYLGAGLATLVSGPIASVLDTRATIIIGAATCLLTSLLALLMREERVAPGESARTSLRTTVSLAFGEVARQPEVRAVMLLSGSTYAAMETLSFLRQPFLLDRGIEVGPLFSALQLPLFVAGLAGSFAAERVLRVAGVPRTLLLGPLLAFAGCAVIAVVPGMAAYPALPLLVALNTCMLPIATGAINRRVSSARRATILSLYNMGASLAMAVIAPVVGYTHDEAGTSSAYLVVGGLALAAVAAFGAPMFALRHRFEERLETAAPLS